MSKPPIVCLVPCKASAVYPRLLSCSNANDLPILGIAHGVRLSILDSNGGYNEVSECRFRQILILGNNVAKL